MPAVVAVAVGIHALSTATPGLPEVIRLDGRINESVRTAVLARMPNDTIYVWRESIHQASAATTIRATMRDDSGDWHEFLLVWLSGERHLVACQKMIDASVQLQNTEVSRGDMPDFVTRLPARTLACNSGSMWRAYHL